MPFADERGVVTGGFEQLRQQRGVAGKIAPGVIGRFLADDAGHADAVRVTAGEQRGARRRADATVGEKIVEGHAFVEQPVDVRRANVFGAEGAVIAAAEVIGEDDEEIEFWRQRGIGVASAK